VFRESRRHEWTMPNLVAPVAYDDTSSRVPVDRDDQATPLANKAHLRVKPGWRTTISKTAPMGDYTSETSSPRMLRYTPSRARPAASMATRCVGRSRAGSRRGLRAVRIEHDLVRLAQRGQGRREHRRGDGIREATRTSAPRARRAVQNGGARRTVVSATPCRTTKPVVRDNPPRRRRSASAARARRGLEKSCRCRAPPGYEGENRGQWDRCRVWQGACLL